MKSINQFFNLSEKTRPYKLSTIIAAACIWDDTNLIRNYPVIKEMTFKNLIQIKREFVKAAKNILNEGYEGVELNIANGNLLEQFLSPICNSRVDKYGGNIENRSRFVIEVVTNVAETIGRENTAICLSPYGEGIAHYPEINDTYAYLSANFNRLGIAYIRLDDNFIKRPHKIPIKLRKLMRNNFKNSIILSGWL